MKAMAARRPPETIVVPIKDFSDGDPNHRPTNPAYRLSDDTHYRKKLAAKWMEEMQGAAVAGKWRQYIMSEL